MPNVKNTPPSPRKCWSYRWISFFIIMFWVAEFSNCLSVNMGDVATTTTAASPSSKRNNNGNNRNRNRETGIVTSSSSTSSKMSFHLVSLPPLTTNIHTMPSSDLASSINSSSAHTKITPKCIRDLWRWKDKCLGDGRDFFVPRPRAIKTLNRLLLDSPSSTRISEHPDGVVGLLVKEVAVLSNCARMDILIVCCSEHNNNACSDDAEEKELTLKQYVRHSVATILARQLKSYEQFMEGSVWETIGVAAALDIPGMVSESPLAANPSSIECIAKELVHVVGVNDIARHLCKVSVGIAERPSRPGRTVEFRPFSSRDAHIMLQMKRTKELATGSRIQAILDTALQAGKAARDPKIVPQLEPLRGLGDSNNYPSNISAIAAKAATDLAIEPALERLCSKMKAMDASASISDFLASVESFMDLNDVEGSERKKVKKIIHEPLMSLREGGTIDREELWIQIKNIIKT